jgi:RimJ/RimL family protein N-acetyltransferase
MRITECLNRDRISAFFFGDPKLVYLGCTDETMFEMFQKGEYNLLPDSQYVGIEENNKLIAVVRYEYFTDQCVSMHMFMNSEFHVTDKPTQAVNLLKTFIKEDLEIDKVILIVPSSCVHIHKFATRHGFEQEGCIKKSCKWRQEMADLVIYGMSL